MEFDELVTKLMNHIDATAVKTENKIMGAINRQIDQVKGDIIREVNVLLEDQHQQFNTFGEGLDMLRDQMNERFDEVNQRLDHLSAAQTDLKMKITDLDQEFDSKIRRVK